MIAVFSAQQDTLESPVDPRFGRCAYLIKVDTESNEWEAFINPGTSQSGGAGIAAAQFVIDKKAAAVVSGDFGPNASNTFKVAGIAMFLYGSEVSTVKQAVEFFQQDKLQAFS
ncbi:MAG TPA: NifB/NifX family molybdenum-iron cluster-binding protein [Anaerolineaceae bacterium]|nr:NifB/NifX family molybdenum-iron cluster-binding protein [Anaerolineaceae bacterium]HPC05889.1 NifB/NifX family molybdenum-iron cluster-binding protein [Anaerolineaceae bacterium]HQP08388.1 NifB/NifX family molybdenum-iron cluster-binding protein [Anaerolineaceae bacterium]